MAVGTRLPINQAPILIEDDLENIAGKMEAVKGKPLNYTLKVDMKNPIQTNLKPFYQIHDSRYMMYWLALTNSGYKNYVDSLTTIETNKIALEKRTIDYVATGEQQPEKDHEMLESNSKSGNSMDEFWRDANREGYFSYKMKTGSEKQLTLLLKYWGFEWGKREFDIYVDDEKLTTVNNTSKYNISQFQNASYSIPQSMLEGKEFIRIKFKALPNSSVSAIYGIRLTK